MNHLLTTLTGRIEPNTNFMPLTLALPPSQTKLSIQPGWRQALKSGWGMELYAPDPHIYEPYHDALHRGKAAHFLMVKIFEHCKRQGWIQPGNRVLDPFGGSGRTGIVGSIMGYPVTLMEIEPIHARLSIPKNIAHAKNHERHLWSFDPEVHEGNSQNLPFADHSFDAIITSPPYADQIDDRSTPATIKALGKTGREPSSIGTLSGYGATEGQIGRLKIGTQVKGRETYEAAMSKVYQECARVTKSGGIMVTIIKDGIKQGKRLPINRINRQLIYQAGFELIDAKLAEIHRGQTELPDLFGNPSDPRIIGHRVSYFRRWHYKKNPKALIRYEHICFYRKL